MVTPIDATVFFEVFIGYSSKSIVEIKTSLCEGNTDCDLIDRVESDLDKLSRIWQPPATSTQFDHEKDCVWFRWQDPGDVRISSFH